MLREAVAMDAALGRQGRSYMERGALVPDDVLHPLIADRPAHPDAKPGFVPDGFPRTIAQAEALEQLLAELGQQLDRVIFFDVSEPELLRRLTGRRSCPVCQATYHLAAAPPRREGVCDRCGSVLVQREDDREATVRTRLRVYNEQTAPLLDYYRSRVRLVRSAGEGSIESRRGEIRRAAGAASA